MQGTPFDYAFSAQAAREAEERHAPRYAAAVDTPFGRMSLVQRGDYVSELRFSGDFRPGEQLRDTPLLACAAQELAAYFAGERTRFTLPLAPLGTPFQALVWQTLAETTPFGATVAYGELARRADKPLAARAVGMACHLNPLPLFIPCHRVVAAGGRLGGFGGALALKKGLLALEGVRLKD